MKDKGRDMPEKGNDATGSVVKPEDAAPSTASGRSSVVEDSIPNGSGGQPGHVNGGSTSAESSTTLLSEATVLLKSLKSLKAMKLKLINVDAAASCRQWLSWMVWCHSWVEDGLRSGDQPVGAGGGGVGIWYSVFVPISSTQDAVEQDTNRANCAFASLGSNGLQAIRLSGCKIFHPGLGVIQCYLRNDCPVMDRDGALEILTEMERLDNDGVDLQADELRWWKEHFPLVPGRVLRRFRGKGEEWDPDLLPWNKRQRRAHARRGVAIHLFSGSNTKKWIRPEVGDRERIFIDTCLGSQLDLHCPVVWSYLWSLASQGLVKLAIGGPP